MERYVKVPVKFCRYADGIVRAIIASDDVSALDEEFGDGSTEDEAFAILLEKLGYEEAK